MSAQPFISELQSGGFRLFVDGDLLKITPASNLTDEQRQRIRKQKLEIIAALKSETLEHSIQLAMERATDGIDISPDEFRAAIDADEAELCATGEIPLDATRAYARLFADKSWQ